MAIVTLVGKRTARIGNRFVYSGPARKCRDCVLRKVCCDKLEAERVYIIIDIRDRFHDCPLHEDGVQLVDVEEAPVKVAIPTHQLFEGAVFTFHPNSCDELNCPNNEICYPTGLKEGDRCRIEEIIQKTGVECSRNQKLGCALVHRVC